jgi:hypothetical protein
VDRPYQLKLKCDDPLDIPIRFRKRESQRAGFKVWDRMWDCKSLKVVTICYNYRIFISLVPSTGTSPQP